jgi:hypothetical protein
MPRKATKSEDVGLPPVQEKALAALLAGKTVVAAAADANVSRESVFRWLRDPVFVAAYNTAKIDLRDAARAELRTLTGAAVNRLRTILTDPNLPPTALPTQLRAALAVLEMVGAATPEDIGSSDPRVVRAGFDHDELLNGILGILREDD